MPVTAINGGPHLTLDEAFSMYLRCQDQAEVDHYWEVLSSDGGATSRCGWLRDRFGLSWQVGPRELEDIMAGSDAAGVARAVEAMLGMTKLDVAVLRAAYERTAQPATTPGRPS